MADVVDIAAEQQEREEARRKLVPYNIPPGKPGDCKLCGEKSARLINGACAPCRDKHKIK